MASDLHGVEASGYSNGGKQGVMAHQGGPQAMALGASKGLVASADSCFREGTGHPGSRTPAPN